MTLGELDRKVRNVLTLAVIAAHADPDNLDELGGNATMLLADLRSAGGFETLVTKLVQEKAVGSR